MPTLPIPLHSSGARFSECRTWRYLLWRIWDSSLPVCAVVGLNPSTADETRDDRTVAKCIRFAHKWNYGALHMLNIHAYRTTYPAELKHMSKTIDVTGPQNDLWLIKTARSADIVIAAWGTHGAFLDRGETVRSFLPNLHRLGSLTKDGFPRHPLYLPGHLTPEPF